MKKTELTELTDMTQEELHAALRVRLFHLRQAERPGARNFRVESYGLMTVWLNELELRGVQGRLF
jgi:hypothetical protein